MLPFVASKELLKVERKKKLPVFSFLNEEKVRSQGRRFKCRAILLTFVSEMKCVSVHKLRKLLVSFPWWTGKLQMKGKKKRVKENLDCVNLHWDENRCPYNLMGRADTRFLPFFAIAFTF